MPIRITLLEVRYKQEDNIGSVSNLLKNSTCVFLLFNNPLGFSGGCLKVNFTQDSRGVIILVQYVIFIKKFIDDFSSLLYFL